MAHLLPGAPTPHGPLWPRRDGLDYEQYKAVHDSHIAALEREGIIVDASISFRETMAKGGLRAVNIVGRVEVASGATVFVDKWLAAERTEGGTVIVQTKDYDYHVHDYELNVGLVRYDNSHRPDELHRHRYNCAGEDCFTEPIDLDRMPRLSDVIREAHDLALWARGHRC